MAEISIKSFYTRSDATVEIRRFALAKEEAKNFNLMREKLLSVYNGAATNDILTREDVVIAWKDEEGDEVSISSDDELNFALKAQRGDVFKLNLRKIKKATTSSPRSKCHHPGVVCDNCNKEIYGFRYKCMECPNFDLCGGCEGAGNHSEHAMMRLVTPGSRFPHHWFRNSRPYHRGHHKWNKFTENNNNNNNNGACGDGAAAPGAKRPCDSRRARFTGEPFHPYNLINRVWSALGVQMPPQKAQKEAEGGENSTSGANASSDEQNETKLAPDDYLRSVGEAVANLLDPFGIDVLVDVEAGGVRTTVSRKEKPNEEKADPEAAEDVEMGGAGQAADAETGVTENVSSGQSENSDKEKSDEGEWTCLEHEVEESMRHLPELLSQFHVQEPPAAHADPKIAESIDQMTSMGFSNDGGWLTALLTLCNGDVTRVIDMLAELGESNGPTRPFIQAFVALLEKYEGDTAKVVAIMRSMNGQ